MLSDVRVVALCLVASTTALAQPRSAAPPLVGATELAKLTAPVGFIDDPIAADDQRIAYVVAQTGTSAELHVLTLAGQQDQVVDLAPVTLHPIALRLVGARAFVVGENEDHSQVAALIELAPTKRPGVVYRLGPATNIAVITRDGQPRVAVHRATASKSGTRHDVDLVALDTGRKLGSGHVDVDGAGTSTQLDFRVNHWGDGWTRAFGIKGGEWDQKENQRTPDVEATYDLVAGKVTDRHPIADLFEQRKRFEALARADGQLDFLRTSWDNTAVQIWRAGKPISAELDQAFATYDPKSLQGIVEADGSAWFVLEVDPVNPDAVARKKADPEYLDLFRAGPDAKAVRKARVLATGARMRFGAAGTRFWLLERSNGFDRGGTKLTVYQL